MKRFRKQQQGSEFYSGRNLERIPVREVVPWNGDIVASYTGPNAGLTKLDLDSTSSPDGIASEVGGTKNWNNPSEFAYGISLSLYEEDRTAKGTVNGTKIPTSNPTIIGEPVADVFAIQARETSAILAIADGVNWGRKARLAARCAVHAVMEHLSSNFAQLQSAPTSHTVSRLLLESVTKKAQELILQHHATLTTLSAAVVCEMANPGEWGLFVVAVGDSPVYVYCPHSKQVMEATVGCHPHNGDRDMRMAGGVLGPSMGSRPDLENLTVAYMPIFPGDIVFCTSDGVSDNFSSKVMKSYCGKTMDSRLCTYTTKPQLKACCENIVYMTALLRKHQEQLDRYLSAQTVAACLINHAVEITEQKRSFRSHCIENHIDIRRRSFEDPEFAAQLKSAPGKLDHATVVSYQVGRHPTN